MKFDFHWIFPHSVAFINRRQASQRELDEILSSIAAHSQIETPVFEGKFGCR